MKSVKNGNDSKWKWNLEESVKREISELEFSES